MFTTTYMAADLVKNMTLGFIFFTTYSHILYNIYFTPWFIFFTTSYSLQGPKLGSYSLKVPKLGSNSPKLGSYSPKLGSYSLKVQI